MSLEFNHKRPGMKLHIELHESPSWNYQDRTVTNVKESDFTIAFAADFTTAGERLTMREASYQGKWIGIPMDWTVERASRYIMNHIFKSPLTHFKLNIAGNGIYTMAKKGLDQEQVNKYIYKILSEIYQILRLPSTIDAGIISIRSGGQTGADHAGLVAGLALGIPVIGLYPKGYRRRNEDQQDFNTSEQNLLEEIITDASKLNTELLTPMGAMMLGLHNGELINSKE